MSSLLTSLLTFFSSLLHSLPFFNPPSSTPLKTVLLGLQNSGKSTFLSPQTLHPPTLRPSTSTLQIGRRTFTTIDLGGQKNLRHIWKDYTPKSSIIIFIIDITTYSTSLPSLKNEFTQITNTFEGPIAVCYNKIDLITSSPSIEEYKKMLVDDEEDDEDIKFFFTSGLKGEGVKDVFEWLGEKCDGV
ncbi:hypothetical protein TrST_g2456 [Triparma strigata]|uniref:Uncharacterized protein n=1 Tax=Triparma strigata TaxID=1606541 RepID=A0A9W7BWA0_9STRA|nr:hypothetical protein TrST_g2456 [Triparma strigata]